MILALTLPASTALGQSPTAASLSPAVTGIGGGRLITVTGQAFLNPDGTSAIDNVCVGQNIGTPPVVGPIGLCLAASGGQLVPATGTSVTTATFVAPSRQNTNGPIPVSIHFAAGATTNANTWFTVGDAAGDLDFSNPFITAHNPPSLVANVSQTGVVLTGGRFEGVTEVRYQHPAQIYEAINEVVAPNFNTVTFDSPAMVPGNAAVCVRTPVSFPVGTPIQNTCSQFTVAIGGSTATNVTPASGPPLTEITITGSNFQGITDVLFIGPLPGTTATSDQGTPVVNAAGTTITSIVPATLAGGTYSLSIVGPGGTIALPLSFSVTGVGTPFPTPVGGFGLTVHVQNSTLSPSTPSSPGGSCGQVVPRTAPFTALTLAPGAGLPIPNVNVVAVLVNDANTARIAVTDANGNASFPGITPGTYRVTSADNTTNYTTLNVAAPVGGENGEGTLGAGQPAGHLIDTRIVNLFESTTLTVNLTCKTAPLVSPLGPPIDVGTGAGTPATSNTSIVFGYLSDWFTGLPIPGANILVNVNVGTVDAPQPGAQIASVLTNADGRFETLEVPSGPVVVRVAPALGLNCVVTRANQTTLIPGPNLNVPSGVQSRATINTCTDALQLLPGRLHDPAFIGASAGAGVAGTMQGVIPMVYRDADITRTGGIRIETTMVRLSNAGPIRTVACIDWHNSDSNGTRIGTERDCLDLNAGAVGIFTNIGDLIPAGIMGYAEVYSIDQDGPVLGSIGPDSTFEDCPLQDSSFVCPGLPGTIYGISDIQGTVSYQVREAGNAIAGNNMLSAEDLTLLGGEANQNAGIATVFKNYSGTAHRHSSVVQACNTTGVPVRQPVVFTFIGITGQRGATGASDGVHTLSADPGGCVSFNMNDITFLRDGTYAVRVISTGLQTPPLQNFLFPTRIGQFGLFDDIRVFRPNSFFVTSVTYSRTGNMANALHGYRATSSAGGTAPGLQFGQLFGALVFNDYNGWNTGISVANFASFGDGGTATVNLTFYDESSRVVGTIGDAIGGEDARTFYLPQLPFTLPPGFKGMVVVQGVPAEFNSESGIMAYANHVNYARNHNISYMFTRDEYLRAPPAQDTRPCVGLGRFTGGDVQFLQNIQSCLWVSEAVKQAPGGIPNGNTTGVRLFNPTNQIAEVEIVYYDSAGFEWVDARTLFNIPAFTQATLFLGTERRLPEVWTGSMYIKSSSPVVGVANVVNYGVTGRDESRAFNLPNQSGLTQ
jgi:hypothetical protein